MNDSIKHLLQGLAFLILVTQFSVAQTTDDFKPATTNLAGSEYPKVSSDGRVMVRLVLPDAAKVQVRIGMGQTVDLVKDEQGVWTATTPPVSPGFNPYSFIVDGIQVTDPGSDLYYSSSRPTSGIDIPSPGEDFFLLKNVPHGDMREHWYYSDITGKWRRIYVYTPPDYEKDVNAKFPVLYILHGMGENETSWWKQGHLGYIMDNMLAEGKITPMIVVMEWGVANDKNAPSPAAPQAQAAPPAQRSAAQPAPQQGDQGATRGAAPAGAPGGASFITSANTLEQVFVKELIPHIDSYYRVKPGRENRAMAGLSLGGFQTLIIGLNHPELFSSYGFFSAAIIGGLLDDPKTAFNGIFADAASFNSRTKVMFFAAGTAEQQFHDMATDAITKLNALGIKTIFYESPNTQHEWLTWRRDLYQFAPRLFK
jgi:enterochelin esterase-like enzyme